jgi:rsbT co-antagonist protein RsbR
MTESREAFAGELEGLRRRLADYEQREHEWQTTEAELRRSLALYQLVLDTLPQSIFWKDVQHLRYLGCNQRFAQDAGLTSPADFIGKDDFQFVWAPEAESYRADDQAVLDSGVPRINFEEPQSREDGTTAWLRTSKLPLVDADGALLGVLGMYEDVTALKQAERERLEGQERVIAAQQDNLRELSTPLLPLADKVVAMPLVGAIDSHRASQIMEVLLEGIAAHQAQVALLDISGVRVVDTQVADALLRAARAAKLLGTQVVLTGMSVEIAQTVVTLGADLSGIITVASLRDGLRYALSQP